MLLPLAFLLQAASAPSPAATTPSSPEIVVEGRTESIVDDFVKQLVDPAPGDQIPRWNDSLCPGIIGLAQDQAEAVNDRIAQLAKTAQLRSGKPGCKPTVLIVFTTKANSLAQAIADKYPITLRSQGATRLTRFREQQQAVRWIGITYEGAARNGAHTSDSVPIGSRLPQDSASGYSMYATRLSRITQAVLSAMLVIVDPNELGSVKLDSLADYLTMVALTRPPLGRSAPSRSILSLFEHADLPHQTLTQYDQDYLKALYSSPSDKDSYMQSSEIIARMNRAKTKR